MSSVKRSTVGDDVCLLTLDMPGKSANVLTDDVYRDLDEALKEIEANPPRGIVLISAKPTIFIAGADLTKISKNLDWSDEKIFAFCEHGRSIMARFSKLPETVSVAAIHGVCVGGGLELPLWCDCRIASDDRRTLLGLPEVKLGLIPGWAGTVRLPRLIGLEAAADLAVSGDLITADESQQLGITSLVVPQDALIPSAIQLIDRELYTQAYLKRRERLAAHVKKRPRSIRQFRQSMLESIESQHDLDPTVPRKLLEHLIRSAKQPAEEACRGESQLFAQVWGGQENRGLLHFFFVEERAKKTKPHFGEEPPQVNSVGIVGAGQMGAQIGRLAAVAGYNVKVHDADERKRTELAQKIKHHPNCQAEQVASVDSLAEFADCDLVIESIVEKPKVKRQLFQSLGQIVSPRTFLCTNTSTIPVREIADATPHPERLVGLHFCCPVEPLKLVEIIRGEQTSAETLNVAIQFIRQIRKTPVVVQDRPGFVVNRMLCPMFNATMHLLMKGIDPQRIDRLFRDFGFAVGPLEMIDVIGVDTIMYAGETFLRTLPDLVTPTPILPALVKRGRLGRKTGVGFYRYESPDAPPQVDAELTGIVQTYCKQPAGGATMTDQELMSRLLDPMVTEAKKTLSEEVVEDARDVDLCSVLGATFPKVRGGILYWSENLGGFDA